MKVKTYYYNTYNYQFAHEGITRYNNTYGV